LQDHSLLPTIPDANRAMFLPSVAEFGQVLRETGRDQEKRFGETVLASFMTWSYYQGATNTTRCPGNGGNPGCYPLESLDDYADCKNSEVWYNQVATHPCQAYALARGYAESLRHGAQVLIPAGLAWEAARGSEPIPQACREAVDANYGGPGPLAGLELPLRAANAEDARWRGEGAHDLYRFAGPDFNSFYCTDGCHHDHHPSALGAYLNALVFFATIFKRSPVGAAWPQGQEVDGRIMPTVGESDARALQKIAHDVVLPHMEVWWSGKPPPLPRSTPKPTTQAGWQKV